MFSSSFIASVGQIIDALVDFPHQSCQYFLHASAVIVGRSYGGGKFQGSEFTAETFYLSLTPIYLSPLAPNLGIGFALVSEQLLIALCQYQTLGADAFNV